MLYAITGKTCQIRWPPAWLPAPLTWKRLQRTEGRLLLAGPFPASTAMTRVAPVLRAA